MLGWENKVSIFVMPIERKSKSDILPCLRLRTPVPLVKNVPILATTQAQCFSMHVFIWTASQPGYFLSVWFCIHHYKLIPESLVFSVCIRFWFLCCKVQIHISILGYQQIEHCNIWIILEAIKYSNFIFWCII